MGLIDLGHEADPVLTRLVDDDKVSEEKFESVVFFAISDVLFLLGIIFGEVTTVDGAGKSTHVKRVAAMHMIARMFLGFCILFAIVSGSAMLGELAYPKERPVMTSLFNASWSVGSLVASGITVRTATINTDW
ncbi:hypothetical protein SBOR_3510 [Sclerotinia borealis F-4128]|uniref:Major facilitator superfamily (MFS) profile domain-containing protein n=1 Tax=Sclerotinia borealis (strain F-4128) TaxID=1432307 RepID=W9CJS3_SCLBF|nr:hypothetical protein SBOR_3510 [Sclerotinia borealis F-4128]